MFLNDYTSLRTTKKSNDRSLAHGQLQVISYSTVGTLIDTGSQSVVVANTVEEYCAIILRVDTPSVPPYLTQKSASFLFSFVRFHFHGATTTTVQYLS